MVFLKIFALKIIRFILLDLAKLKYSKFDNVLYCN